MASERCLCDARWLPCYAVRSTHSVCASVYGLSNAANCKCVTLHCKRAPLWHCHCHTTFNAALATACPTTACTATPGPVAALGTVPLFCCTAVFCVVLHAHAAVQWNTGSSSADTAALPVTRFEGTAVTVPCTAHIHLQWVPSTLLIAMIMSQCMCTAVTTARTAMNGHRHSHSHRQGAHSLQLQIHMPARPRHYHLHTLHSRHTAPPPLSLLLQIALKQ